MTFSSNTFLFAFLPLTLLGYYLIRKDLRNLFLLVTSLVFFAWAEIRAVPVLVGVILLSYLAALLMDRAPKGLARRLLLVTVVLGDIAILGYYKYTNFFIEILNSVTGQDITARSILLPVGISFFVFQSISYLVDVYREKVKPTRNLIKASLYFAMFPKLTQGPIMRYGDMEGELDSRNVDVQVFSDGIQRFIIGLTKKLLIADQLGGVADSIFDLGLQGLSTPLAWGGIIAYTLQIYFDFSCYSDMAIGLARMFGFHLMENFNYPYIATSITDFWRRWHISLSSWFRDYLYIPLGGNRRGNKYVNLFIVFLATGIWHGAAWTFVVWGVYHGVIRILESLLEKPRSVIPKPVSWVVTMLLVMVGWVFFRAADLQTAMGYIATMFGLRHGESVHYMLRWFYDGKIVFITGIALLAMFPWKQLYPKAAETLEGTYLALIGRFIAMLAMLAICVVLAMTSTYHSFIYFQF